MRGHGPLGMEDDPLSVPCDPDRPDYCDVNDVGPDTPWESLTSDWWSRDLQVFAGVGGTSGAPDSEEDMGIEMVSSMAEPVNVTKTTIGRLFFLDVSVGGRIVSASSDGSDRRVIIEGCRTPDGIVVELAQWH